MRNTLLILTAICTLSVSAADISPTVKAHLHRKAEVSRADDEEPPYQPMMLQIEGEEVVDTMVEMGVIIFNRRADLLLTSIPKERLLDVLQLEGVVNADISGDMSAVMDKARPMGRVNAVQSGDAPLLKGYDGAGVVTGFSDIGFDARHIAFKDRISAIYDYDAAWGKRMTAETPEEISAWTTDNADEYHATHVANILGGNYRGNGYYGVATGAEIVATTSNLTDVGILAGVEDIIAYAKNADKPAVINLSLGNSLGPHDGTSLFCQYLSRCAEDAVICLSAGNTATTQGYAYCQLEDPDDIRRVVVNSKITWDGFDVYGLTEIWGIDSTPFDFRVEVFDKNTKEIVYASEWANSATGTDEIALTDENEKWAEYFTGEVYAWVGISPLNGRYCVSALYDTHTEEPVADSDGRWSRYYTSLAVRACEGSQASVQFFADATYSMIGIATHETKPTFSAAGTISDMCTASGIIAVGSCNSRNKAPLIYGETHEQEWNFNINQASGFSSYSDVPWIKPLPHFCAPGNMVVSALSGEFAEAHPEILQHAAAESTVDGRTYYWIAQCGTSMASPFAAGVIAQWLQKNPNLTVDEIINIAQSTARTDFYDINSPQWGAGCIDALTGLERVIELSSLPTIQTPTTITVTADGQLIVNAEKYHIYTIDGIEIDNNNKLARGVYIVKIAGGECFKVSVR